MDVSNSDVLIPNLSDFSALLIDDEDLTKCDRKYMPLGDEGEKVVLPNT